MLPAIQFPEIIFDNVPQSGASQECQWLRSGILARLPEWVDHSTVELAFAQTVFSLDQASSVTWNEDSFVWCEDFGYWLLSFHALISW